MTDQNQQHDLWLNMKELGERYGVSRQAMKKRVDKLVSEHGLETKKDGRSVLVNVPHFDLLVSEHGNARAEQSASTRKSAGDPHDENVALREAQRAKAEYDAELTRIKLDKEKGTLVDVKVVEATIIQIGAILLKELELIVTKSDEISRASGGVNIAAGRAEAKKIRDNIRNKIAIKLEDAAVSETGQKSPKVSKTLKVKTTDRLFA